MPEDADVLRRPGFIELNRISENTLKDLARKHKVESRAALAGAM